jgi:hypothetical protein
MFRCRLWVQTVHSTCGNNGRKVLNEGGELLGGTNFKAALYCLELDKPDALVLVPLDMSQKYRHSIRYSILGFVHA